MESVGTIEMTRARALTERRSALGWREGCRVFLWKLRKSAPRMACCAYVLAFASHAQPSGPSELAAREERLRDAYEPVITMEQLGDAQNNLQGYRIQIFKDGRVKYHGLREVRTLGEVLFDIEPERVQHISDEFAKYKFWQVPEVQYDRGLPGRAYIGHAYLFTLRRNQTLKSIHGSGSSYELFLLKIIEDQVNSSRWRCPYVDSVSDEKCVVFKRALDFHTDIFVKRELPILLEKYK